MNIIPFSKIALSDLPEVGGKNASLGEMFNKLGSLGILVPDGFAITATAYRYFLKANSLEEKLTTVLSKLDKEKLSNLPAIGKECRQLISGAKIPADLAEAITSAYNLFAENEISQFSVAVRSSATAEDLPTASFAGQHESYLNVIGAQEVVKACQLCYVSLFFDRAIKYRIDNGFDHMQVALSVGVQKMVRSDVGCSGVAFTLEPESGFRNAVYITGAWGLGENIVQGAVGPDEFVVFKPTLLKGFNAIVKKKLGEKEKTMVYANRAENGKGTLNLNTEPQKRNQFVLSDVEVHELAKWCCIIEKHYKEPMDKHGRNMGFRYLSKINISLSPFQFTFINIPRFRLGTTNCNNLPIVNNTGCITGANNGRYSQFSSYNRCVAGAASFIGNNAYSFFQQGIPIGVSYICNNNIALLKLESIVQ